MKQGIHPDYHLVFFRDRARTSPSSPGDRGQRGEPITWEDGSTHPVVDVEISSASHPFIHRAGARPRHGRRVEQVPAAGMAARQGGLRLEVACGPPRDHGLPALEPGGPFLLSPSPDHAGR